MVRGVFQTTILEHQMLCSGDGVVAALSGGPDSMALLCLLLDVADQRRLRIHGAHLNHGLRGPEADEDESFVRSQCRDLGVPFTSSRAEAPPAGENVEQWAREVRYRFLEQVRSDLGFQRIALGHTRDDLAETLLMRLLRGSGLTGLACLRPVRGGGLIRPMIGITRDELLGFLEERGQLFRTDSSNIDTGRLRNRIRHELIPLLERNYNPRARERLAATAGLVSDDEDWLDQAAEGELARLTAGTGGDGPVALPCAPLAELPPSLARRVIRGALRQCLGHLRRISRDHVASILRLAAARGGEEKRLDLPGALLVRRSSGRLLFEAGPGEEAPAPWRRVLAIPGETPLEECELVAMVTIGPGPDQTRGWPDARTSALLDADAARQAGLVFRSRRAGDRYQPAGAPGSRRVSRMMIDDRVPRHRRPLVPLLASGDEPIWLPGRLPAAKWCWSPDSGAPCLRLDLRHAGDGDECRGN